MKIKAKDYRTHQFQRFYQSKWLSLGKTNKEFADRIGLSENGFQTVSRWNNGQGISDYYLEKICEVLEVPVSEFYPQDRKNKYQYSSPYADSVEKDLEEAAEKYFGIDLTFLQGIRNIMPDFDDAFPIHGPLAFGPFDSNEKYYQRAVPNLAAETTGHKGLFQISRMTDDQEAQTYFISKYDMKAIRLIQNDVAKFVRLRFQQIAEKLNAAETEANIKCLEAFENPRETPDGWLEYEGVSPIHGLPDDVLQQIDPLGGFYTEKEKKRYHIPEPKKGDNHND